MTVEFAIADADGEEGQTVVGTDGFTESDHGGCGSAPCTKTITATTAATGATATDADGNTSEFSSTAPLLEATRIDVAGESGPGSILSGRIFDPTLGTPAVALELSFFAGADCTGTSLGTASLSRLEGDTSLEWPTALGWAEVLDGAASALPTLRYTAAGASPNEVQIDRVLLTPMIFGDGFESGDTSSWSASQP